MRLRTLDLIRYGRFTNRSLDFGTGGGATDVTLVYGPNEAGKSTAFSAWLDLLFGLKHGTHPYAFLHDRKDLMVGATLDTAEGALTLRRTGQRTGSLTDDEGRQIDERRLQTLLFGLGRDEYRTRFSLDDEELRRGGDQIAQAKGELGQLLHAGSSGLSGFAEVLAQAEQEAEGFHKPRGRTTELAEGKSALKEIDATLEAARLDPRRFEELLAAVAEAEQALAQADRTRAAARRALAIHEAVQTRHQLATRIEEIDTELAELPEGPDLPEDAFSTVIAASEALTRAEAEQTRAASTIHAADDALAGTVADTEGLAIAALLDDLQAATLDDGQPLLSRASTDAADVARRRDQRDEVRVRCAEVARRLAGLNVPHETVALGEETRRAIRDAAQEVDARARALAQSEASLAEARTGLGEAEEMPAGADALADALAAHDALRADPDTLAETHAERQDGVRRAAAGLSPDWRARAEAGLPTAAELRAAEAELTGAQADLRRAEEAAEDATERLQELSAEREAEVAVRSPVTDADIVATRRARDARWVTHRADLEDASADAFEAAMRADDAARDTHGRSVEARARLARIEGDLAKARTNAERRQLDLDDAQQHLAGPAAVVRALATRLGLPEDTAHTAFPERLDALRTALEAALAGEAAEQAHADARAARDSALEHVAEAFAAFGGSAPDPTRVLAPARRLHADLEARRARIASREQARQMVDRIDALVKANRKALAEASSLFTRRTEGLWCARLEPEAFLAIADDLASLAEHQRAAADLERRVDRLEDTLANFEARAADLRAALDSPDASIDALLRDARTRARSARETETRIREAQEDKERAEAHLEDQRRAASEASARIETVLRGQSVPQDVDAVAFTRILQKRDTLRASRTDTSVRRASAADGFGAAELAEEEAQADPLRGRMLADAAALAEENRDTALGRRGEARQALQAARQTVGAVDHAQSRAALLESLREGARRAAVTRIGLLSARAALGRLREDRRGPMLEAAEAAFSRMTAGEWPRLQVQPSASGERLVGIHDGAACAADAMSTGTRGQLYLALRVAGHSDFIQRHGPLPFVTDDILESFDNTRAAAALALTAEMGRTGQAIMFTHHQHLVDLARGVIPGVNVIDLDA